LLSRDETPVAETLVTDRPSASLAHLAPEERLRHCTTEVRSLAGAILGLDIGAVDLDQGFFDMGFDSLMGLELKHRLEAAMGISLPATLVLNYPTVRDLAEFIAGGKLNGSSLIDAADPADSPPESANEIEAYVEDLDVAVVHRLERLEALMRQV
jgi:acyl carrier protein